MHQLIPCFTPGDAMGQAALAWQRALRYLGFTGELFADEVTKGLSSLVKPASSLRPSRDDVVLYHHGIASPLAGKLLHLDCVKGVVFHNITPAHFYAGTRLVEPLRAGRAQLAALAEGVDVSIGVSAFNAAELRAAGHRNVHVAPLYVEPERFGPEYADEAMVTRLGETGQPRVVAVSRVVAHKRVEDLLALHAELRRLHPDAHLVVVGGAAEGSDYVRRLKAQARALGQVTFLGRATHGELVAAYRAADVFVSMSEHEGFGVPLVEAMAADVPVLAYGAAAVPETMGGRGLVFDEKHFAALAEVVSALTHDVALREKVVAGQRERVRDFSCAATVEALAQALAPWRPKPAKRRARKKPSVALVVQRYGETIVGGAESHARQVAQQLAPHASVEVLTTCAVDHLTWANVLPAGESRDGAVKVRRFPVVAPREMGRFNELSDEVFGTGTDLVTEAHWLAEQGPRAPGLLDELAARRDGWDAVIFFTYLYAPTVWGVPLVADKALVVPTAHDEPPLAFQAFADVFERPRALLCNTPEEVELIRARFEAAAPARVVGVGIEPRPGKPERFRDRYGVRGEYLLYVGRLEAGKGVVDLVRLHQHLVSRFHDAPALVLAGAGDLKPRGERLHVLGRIDEEAKWDALAGALAVVVPSRYESLSLLALEAFAAGAPVLGNAASTVVAGQVQRSGAGRTFELEHRESFFEALKDVGERRAELAKKGKRYAARFRWPRVVAAYLEEIARVGSAACRR
ncbi:MAG: glycosyltransferase family 4 protein [Myxococcota bacterium]